MNHMPLYRQEAQWKHLGLELSRTTMANWIIIASKEYCIPLVNRMHELLINESHVHCDETTVQVLNEPGKASTPNRTYGYIQVLRKVNIRLGYLNINQIEMHQIFRIS